jgi:hypothetical protein
MRVLASQDMFVVQVPSKWPPAAWAQTSIGAQTNAKDSVFLILMDDLQ